MSEEGGTKGQEGEAGSREWQHPARIEPIQIVFDGIMSSRMLFDTNGSQYSKVTLLSMMDGIRRPRRDCLAVVRWPPLYSSIADTSCHSRHERACMTVQSSQGNVSGMSLRCASSSKRHALRLWGGLSSGRALGRLSQFLKARHDCGEAFVSFC